VATQSTLDERVYLAVRTALQSGQLRPGEKVTIRGLAEKLGASMTPARRALARLVAQGALVDDQGKSMRVPVMHVERWREICDMRLVLETLAIRRAAVRATVRDVATLRRLAADLAAARRTGDHARDRELVARFQLSAYQAAAAPLLLNSIDNLWLLTGPYLNLLYPDYIATVPPRWRERLCTHLEKHDADQAAAAIERDLSHALGYIAEQADADGIIRI
jgi:DNA-binding GntR family transcriptional regulator